MKTPASTGAPGTLRIFAALWLIYALLCLPAAFWPAYLEMPPGWLIAAPYLMIYVFHMMGLPGLLQNDGMCGWGWCAPSIFGWLVLALFWLAVSWLVASFIARMIAKRSAGD